METGGGRGGCYWNRPLSVITTEGGETFSKVIFLNVRLGSFTYLWASPQENNFLKQ